MKKKMSSKITTSHNRRTLCESPRSPRAEPAIDCIAFSTATLHYDIIGNDVGLFVGDDVTN